MLAVQLLSNTFSAPPINTFARTFRLVCAYACARALAGPPGSGENQESDSNKLRDCQVETNIMASDPPAPPVKALRWVGERVRIQTDACAYVLQKNHLNWHTRNFRRNARTLACQLPHETRTRA